MVRVRSTTRLPVTSRMSALLIAIAIGAAGGCTMCPDPFDYSGPVPNGSPPQNDFRARSRGILPLGTAPRPWPQVVRAEGATADGAVEVGEDATVETVSVLEPAAVAVGDDEPLAAEGASATEASEPVLEPVPADDSANETAGENLPTEPAEASSSGGSGSELPVEPIASPPSAPLGETPGWRPRR
jgi:hypothetical protein